MQVDMPDPVIVPSASSLVSAGPTSNPVHIGDTVTLAVAGLTQSTTGAGLSDVMVYVGGIVGGAVIIPSSLRRPPSPIPYQVLFTLSPNAPFRPAEAVQVGIGHEFPHRLTCSF